MSFHPNDIARRTRLSTYLLIGGFFALLSAFFNAQILQTNQYQKASEENRFREIPLPEGAIGDKAEATFKDGVLEVKLDAPPREVARGRSIDIKQG